MAGQAPRGVGWAGRSAVAGARCRAWAWRATSASACLLCGSPRVTVPSRLRTCIGSTGPRRCCGCCVSVLHTPPNCRTYGAISLPDEGSDVQAGWAEGVGPRCLNAYGPGGSTSRRTASRGVLRRSRTGGPTASSDRARPADRQAATPSSATSIATAAPAWGNHVFSFR